MMFLRFVDEGGFLGALITNTDDLESAMIASVALGIDPGGHIFGSHIPTNLDIPHEFVDRLLTREDVIRMGVVANKAPEGETT